MPLVLCSAKVIWHDMAQKIVSYGFDVCFTSDGYSGWLDLKIPKNQLSLYAKKNDNDHKKTSEIVIFYQVSWVKENYILVQ
jgi:hypothetical protein